MKLITLFVVLVATCHGLSAQFVKTGADNLLDTDFQLLRGKRVVLVSHAAARVYTGRSVVEEFHRTDALTLVRVLTPEHGYFGVVKAGEHVDDDAFGGVPMLSLYGPDRRPSERHLAGADVVVLDLQDIGSRSYTYISTMTEVMEACAERGLPLVILDRPNPLGGLTVDGNVPDPGVRNFVCRLPIPYIHGMTIGELATMINGMGWLSLDTFGKPRTCSLTVVRCKRWTRDMTWEQTGLTWYPTSPNIPTIAAARAYPVTGLLGELGGVSIGIGTTSPFSVVGTPSMTPDTVLVHRLRRFGVRASSCKFLPYAGAFASKVCFGYQLTYGHGHAARPFTAGMSLIFALRDAGVIKPSATKQEMFVKVCGTSEYLRLLTTGGTWEQAEQRCSAGVSKFKEARAPYLLY